MNTAVVQCTVRLYIARQDEKKILNEIKIKKCLIYLRVSATLCAGQKCGGVDETRKMKERQCMYHIVCREKKMWNA